MNLEDRVDELEAIVQELTGRVDDLEDDRDRLAQENAELRQQLQAKSDTERVDRMYEKMHHRVESLTGQDAYETHQGIPEPELEWLERLEHLGADNVHGHVRERDVHAQILLRGLPDWGFRANNGDIVLPTANKLRAKMKRQLGGSFEYSELYRACEALGERMGSKVDYVEENAKIGRHIRIHRTRVEDVALDLGGVSGPPSASTGGKQKLLAAL